MKIIKVYQTENNCYKNMKLLGTLKYVGKSFGVVSLTNNKIYNCVGYDEQGLVRIIDDSDEDYSYLAINPRLLDGSSEGGKWEPVEIYDDGLKKYLIKLVLYEVLLLYSNSYIVYRE